MRNSDCCLILEILVYILFVLILILGFVYIGIELSSKLEVLSIFIVISVFYGTWRINKHTHNQNQLNLLRSLLNEINILVGERKNYEKMGSHLGWVKNNIPDHLIHEIDIENYITHLDEKISGIPTHKITLILTMVKDKINLINFYLNEERNYLYNLLKEKIRKKENENSKRNKQKNKGVDHEMIFKEVEIKKKALIKITRKKLESPIREAESNLRELKSILIERFNLK